MRFETASSLRPSSLYEGGTPTPSRHSSTMADLPRIVYTLMPRVKGY